MDYIRVRNTINVVYRKVLDAYFAEIKIEAVAGEDTKEDYIVKSGDTLNKIAKKKGSTVKAIIALNPRITETNKHLIQVGQKIKLSKKTSKKKITFTRINSANLGEEVYILVKTDRLQDELVQLNVLQGKAKGLVEKENPIWLQQNDNDVKIAENYVGKFVCDDESIENKDDFKDWAVIKVKLGSKDSKEQKIYTDALEELKDKKTSLFLLISVTCQDGTPVVYNGENPAIDGELDKRKIPNYWLDVDGKWFEIGVNDGVLKEMKILVDKHIPYSQMGVRDSLSEEGLKALDCSETVAIYLHKLGVMPKLKVLHTGVMTTEKDFRKAIGSNNIEFVDGSDKKNFKPERGDVFVWRDGDGHTGIVHDYDALNDIVTILEAIGSKAVGETKQRKNGGYSGTKCSRTAKYGRLDGALYGHRGWKGYFRPINYTKTL
ncbi:MAG: LysM peptidoglycan-binding domain-containing protein [Flavobacteriaceae bacterium]|nr:LysM peptidoglycan-binding domain-containing protein [Flavobacteriaceae bacterium]